MRNRVTTIMAVIAIAAGGSSPTFAYGGADDGSNFNFPKPRGKGTTTFGPRTMQIPDDKAVIEAIPNAQDYTVPDASAPGLVELYYDHIFTECSNYFDSLIKVQNEIHFADDEVTATGAATTTVLGLAKSSRTAIGVVGAVFGLGSTSLKNWDARALMTPYASETKQLIMAQMQAYRDKYPSAGATTKAIAVTYVQNFAELCTYSGITRFAKQALTNAATSGSPTQPDATLNYIESQVSVALDVPDVGSAQYPAIWYYLTNFTQKFKGDPSGAGTDFIKKNMPADAKAVFIDGTGKLIDPSAKPLSTALGLLQTAYSYSPTFKKQCDDFVQSLSAAPAGAGAGGAAPPASNPKTAALLTSTK